MTCMRSCPTQAIRVRDKKAKISFELCVDCGTCISVCPENAIQSITDLVDDFNNFKFKIAIPSLVLYSQFDPSIHPYIIHMALKEIGFDMVVDVAPSSDALSIAVEQYMEEYEGRRPIISSHCPATVRLLQVKFPDLVELVLPLDAPREVTAREIRQTIPGKLGLKPEEIGVFYISPCPAKIVSIKQPAEKLMSWFDGALSIKNTYSLIFPHVIAIKENFDPSVIPDNFCFAADFSTFAGKNWSTRVNNRLVVTSVEHVMKIFDDIENSRLRDVDFVEALTCLQGCVGGPYVTENPYIARANSYQQKHLYEHRPELNEKEIISKFKRGYYNIENPVMPRPTKYFDSDLATSIKRMKEMERVYLKLPQIDCGCCGAPTCKAFAEDFVRNEAKLTDCIFLAHKTGKD